MKLVALIDGSLYSQSVCDYAAWVSKRASGELDLLHVLDERNRSKMDLSGNIGLGARTSLMDELAELDAQHAKLAQKKGRAILDDAKARILDAGVDQIECKLRHGDLVETVNVFEKDADLLLIGKRGEGADFAKMHLGSNLERVIRASDKPVLVVSRQFKKPKSVLLAYDGGASSEKMIESVCTNPIYKDLNVHIVTVAADAVVNSETLKQLENKIRDAGLEVSSEVLTGQPASAITQFVEENDYDLLAMGAYGHSRIRNLIIGSTTTEMIRKCLIPIILYR